MNQNSKVSLGCGTLILIMLIVMVFGNVGSQNLAPQIHSLKLSIKDLERKIGQLEFKLDQQAQNITALRQEMRKYRPEAGQED